ncbi:MAG: preprotein translocase subunit YajC [Actinomycetota bacterium]
MSIFLLFFQGEGGGLSIIWMIAPIILIFYFLIIRPQQKQQKQLQELVSSLKINDEVVTNGGIIGKIKEVRETSFIIQSAEKTFLEVGKSAVIGKKAEEIKS